MAYRQEESDIQKRVVLVLKYQYPNVIFTTSPAGIKMTIGQAVKMKRMGYRPGTPDLMIFEPKGKYHGLFIEIKTSIGVVSKEQKDLHRDLMNKGYAVKACFGYNETIQAIEDYLSGVFVP